MGNHRLLRWEMLVNYANIPIYRHIKKKESEGFNNEKVYEVCGSVLPCAYDDIFIGTGKCGEDKGGRKHCAGGH